MSNHGNYIVSLGNLCRWLAQQAEALGVEIYPGFAAAEVLYNDDGSVHGVATGDMGVASDGHHKDGYHARASSCVGKYTLFAEGARGSLTKTLVERFKLREGIEPQKYGIGLKELWEVDPAKHQPGLVVHSRAGRSTAAPAAAPSSTTSRTIRWRWASSSISITRTRIWRRSRNSSASRLHPAIRPYFEGGKRLAYGARAINEGGCNRCRKLVFPGGALIGCAAGFVNLPRIKGSHNAMKTGMLAAEAAYRRRSRAARPAATRLPHIRKPGGDPGSMTICTACAM